MVLVSNLEPTPIFDHLYAPFTFVGGMLSEDGSAGSNAVHQPLTRHIARHAKASASGQPFNAGAVACQGLFLSDDLFDSFPELIAVISAFRLIVDNADVIPINHINVQWLNRCCV